MRRFELRALRPCSRLSLAENRSACDRGYLEFNTTSDLGHQEMYSNIWIVGPQSTGKTTLVQALKERFRSCGRLSGVLPDPCIIREVARSVLQKHDYTRDDITNSPSRALELQKLILKAQYHAENAALDITDGWFISDRSGLDPMVYAEIFVGDDAAKQMANSDEWNVLGDRMRKGLVVLCEAGCSWLVDDGTRLMPKDLEDWKRVDAAFRRLLKAMAIDVIVIPHTMSDLQDRVDVVLHAFLLRNEQVRSGTTETTSSL